MENFQNLSISINQTVKSKFFSVKQLEQFDSFQSEV